MRVLLATQFFSPVTGGEERLVEDLARELAARGHDVTIATTTHIRESVRLPGVRLRRVNTLLGGVSVLHADAQRRHMPPFPDPLARRELAAIIDEQRPEIVHAHNWIVHSLPPPPPESRLVLSLHDYGLVCANKRLTRNEVRCSGPSLGKCLRCAAHHYGAPKGVTTALALRAATTSLLDRVDHLLPVSDAVARASGLPTRGVPFDVIPNFIPDTLLSAAPNAAPPRDPAIPDGDFFVFAGDLTYDKGVFTLLDAWRNAPDLPPLVLVGRSLPNHHVPAAPRVFNIGARPHDRLIEILRASMGVIVPSVWNEPFGLVALEAMAVGRAPVVSDVGGLAGIVDHDRTGLVAPPGDPHALVALLRRLARDPAQREALGEAARRRAADFAASSIVPRVESVYRALVASEPRHRRAAADAS